MPREAPLMNTFFPLKFVFGVMSAESKDPVNKNLSIGGGWNHPKPVELGLGLLDDRPSLQSIKSHGGAARRTRPWLCYVALNIAALIPDSHQQLVTPKGLILKGF